MNRLNAGGPRMRRRGAVVVQVAVGLTVMLGFAALAVDLGSMYNARAELQRTADAAALAAASMLGEYGESDPLSMARAEATKYAASNTVWGQSMLLDPNVDVVFGRANYDADANRYSFTPTEVIPDAVRIRVRMTSESPNGALGLSFAGVLGRSTADIWAEATAVIVPRDIAIVADLSGSHRFDSSIRNYKNRDINVHELWDGFPGGIDDSPSKWAGLGYASDDPQAAGGAWGLMRYLGWGTMDMDASYDPSGDTGMVRLSDSDWSDSTVDAYLSTFDGAGYSSSEINLINDDSAGNYADRVAVALGLARWNSGKKNGLAHRLGVSGNTNGNGNDVIDSNELTWVETIGDRSVSASQSIFQDYVNNYITKTWTQMYNANNDFQYRFGAKTFLSYLEERRATNAQTPEWADAPQQPMQAVKDAMDHLTATLTSLNSDDKLSLEIYGTTARHEVDLTMNYSVVADRLDEMQASHYDAWTNMGGGIQRGIEELSSSRSRASSRKVMILLTDGWANVNASGDTGDYAGGRSYALQKAQEAADQGIRIFAVSVGSSADTSTMGQIADIGSGEHFYATGSIDEYSDQLDDIFRQLGGQRMVELIE